MSDEDPIELCNQVERSIDVSRAGISPPEDLANAVLLLNKAVRQLALDARDRETAEMERNERG